MKNGIPFPQADDFNKLVQIINATNENLLHENYYVKECIGVVKDRQVSYYLSALMYLDILDKNKKFTKLGKEVRNLNSNDQIIRLKEIVLEDEVFKKAYKKYLKDKELQTEEVAESIKKVYPRYSEAVYKRRAQTVKNWIRWLSTNKEEK